MVQWFRGGHSSPKETEVKWNCCDCKKEMKTRLRSNYSYYAILIVEDAQPITYKCKQRGVTESSCESSYSPQGLGQVSQGES